jgi:NAD-dependent DNA ligase
MPVTLDPDGQPPVQFYAARVAQRAVSELLGLCKGMVCDGEVTSGEAEALVRWMVANPFVTEAFPGNVLSQRLLRIFEDGRADEEERADLLELLRAVTGQSADTSLADNTATALPLDAPPPRLEFDGVEYVFTGKMIFGTRKACEAAVVQRGAAVGARVTQRTRVLVIGTLGSAAWKESTHGNKIIEAVELRDRGKPIRLVSEQHWVGHL